MIVKVSEKSIKSFVYIIMKKIKIHQLSGISAQSNGRKGYCGHFLFTDESDIMIAINCYH